MKRYIKLYEEFVEEGLTLTNSVEVTFRLLIKKGVNAETIKNNFHDKFIQIDNPLFTYKNFTYEDFKIDFIGDFEIDGYIESEYAIKSVVKFEIEEPLDSKVIEHYIKNGIEKFLKEKTKEYVSDETKGIRIMQYELYEI
jgi:hypothetical protein